MALRTMRSQSGSPCTLEGATRRDGSISQSNSLDSTASVPVRQMKLMKIASLRPTH